MIVDSTITTDTIRLCGCVERRQQFGQSYTYVCLLSRCPFHEQEAKERLLEYERQEAQARAYHLSHMSPLNCEWCGEQIGYVHDFDLNGSYFACAKCFVANGASSSTEESPTL